MSKIIITVVGIDTVGIIARVCSYLAEKHVNILDISQTIVQEYFNMMMIADIDKATDDFHVIAEDLDKIGDEIGVKIKCQREEIFTKMHRI
jgi:ACT domain-containing protein